MQMLQGLYSAFRNPLNHSNITLTEEECIKRLIIIDTLLSYVNIQRRIENEKSLALFDQLSKYSLKYYLDRQIDSQIINILNFNHVWIFGESGVGKTNLAIKYMLSSNNKFYHSISFGSVTNSDELFQLLKEELLDKLENDDKVLVLTNEDNTQKDIKQIFSFLSSNFESVTIHFDEIFEFNQNDFHELFNFILETFKNHTSDFSNINIIITSIVNPQEYLNTLPRESNIDKVKEIITFKEMNLWDDTELINLFNLINTCLHTDIDIANILQQTNKKPRNLKRLIKEEIIG